jgi:alpha-tubulin suppressor-like RCC1 family protein
LVTDRAFVAIAAGMRHACAVDRDGAAWCWGFNYRGETGSSAIEEFTPSPHRVTSAAAFTWIGAGDSYTCALTTTGQAQCWGSAWRGELGRQVAPCINTFGGPEACTPIPGPVNTSASFTSLSVGNSHSCGLTAAGAAICWGDNGQGQLGRGDFANVFVAAPAQSAMTFSVISASSAVTCATPLSGASVCWGLNLMGKLGVGTRVELSTAPLPIFGGPRYRAFAGGAMHLCALDTAGAAYCWGSGRNGELGTGERLP